MLIFIIYISKVEEFKKYIYIYIMIVKSNSKVNLPAHVVFSFPSPFPYLLTQSTFSNRYHFETFHFFNYLLFFFSLLFRNYLLKISTKLTGHPRETISLRQIYILRIAGCLTLPLVSRNSSYNCSSMTPLVRKKPRKGKSDIMELNIPTNSTLQLPMAAHQHLV